VLHDHTDLRVSDIAKTRALYDALLPALGYTRVTSHADLQLYYHLPGNDIDFFGINADPDHRANGTRIAFAAVSREQVDELAGLARASGALAFEAPHLCPEYAEKYYATFFEDADGNKLEICCRY
jgi:catechol 2,3-dioxygenase-like lactoylglutathione lyase family enzyme